MAMKHIIIYALTVFCAFLQAQDMERIVSLKGEWKFSIGDRDEWKNPDFNDNRWESIYVPSSWEDQGFHGYDGYAWYRTSFYLSREFAGRSFYLQLGFVDDVDEVYINGNFIGSTGQFPPQYETAYNILRKYPIPQKYLKLNSENVIAVRVYDSQLPGGITSGDVGIFFLNSLVSDYNLEGEWKFNTGDDPQWKDVNYNDNDWRSIIVPGFWENFGYRNYDGFAWYRMKFPLVNSLKGKNLVLLMGKIDDFDEVYLNGVLIGSTGNMESDRVGDEYQKLRGYFIPQGLLKDKNNVVAVRVKDPWKDGGIYMGPVGLIRQEKYTKYWHDQKRKKNIFEILFDN